MTKGPPLSIDWEYTEKGKFEVDDFENTRYPSRRMEALTSTHRQNLLMEHGATENEIRNRIREVHQAKHKRKMSIATQEFEEWQEALELLERKLSRFFNRLKRN